MLGRLSPKAGLGYGVYRGWGTGLIWGLECVGGTQPPPFENHIFLRDLARDFEELGFCLQHERKNGRTGKPAPPLLTVK